jgi:hypothetical protein
MSATAFLRLTGSEATRTTQTSKKVTYGYSFSYHGTEHSLSRQLLVCTFIFSSDRDHVDQRSNGQNGMVPNGVLLNDTTIMNQTRYFLDYVLDHQDETGWLGPEVRFLSITSRSLSQVLL